MRWSMLFAVTLPVFVSGTGRAGVEGPRGAHALAGEMAPPRVHATEGGALLPEEGPALELVDKHCTTPWLGSDKCGDPFDVPSRSTLKVTLVSAKDGGTDKKGEEYTIVVHDNTHDKDQKSKDDLKMGDALTWKNDTGENVKVQLSAKGPGLGRDIHIRYEITK